MMRKLYFFGLIGLVGIVASLAFAEEITLTTYYPAPYGVYNDMVVMNSLGIGTTSPTMPLDVAGAIKVGGSGSEPCTATEEGSQRYNSTSKRMEFCNGSVWAEIGGGLKSMQVLVSNGTWTKPTGVSRIKVIVTGGGGGGGSHNDDDAQGGGGGGGTAIEIIDVEAISSVAVTVGAGGTGSCGNSASGGTDGGTSSFGSYCSATGGSRPSTWGLGGSGGTGTGGDLNLKGDDGVTGNIDGQGNEEAGGTGGSSFWGGGGKGGSYWGGRGDGVQGSGGGGTHAYSNNCGGAGGAGMVVVYEY